jgi:hypothetical protein
VGSEDIKEAKERLSLVKVTKRMGYNRKTARISGFIPTGRNTRIF